MEKPNKIQGIELLQFNHAGAMQLTNGNTVNYGVIRKTDHELVYYTGKGLREMWKPSMNEDEKTLAKKLQETAEQSNGEQILISSGHIAITPLSQIERVIF